MRAKSLFAVLLAAGAGLLFADSPIREELHVVIATRDGTHTAARWPLTEAQLAEAKSIWAWTPRVPPLRIDARGISPRADAVRAELARQASRPLDVRVRGWTRPQDLASIRVICAPSEMWASVPEALLPTYQLTKEGRVAINVRGATRIRVVSEAAGTMWEEVAPAVRSLDVVLRRPAADAELSFRSEEDGSAGRVFALAMSRRRSDAAQTIRAQYTTDDQGVLRIPALPASEVITLFVTSEHSAPETISGTASDLSRTIRLSAPAKIQGKFVDGDGNVLSGVKIEAEGWASAEAPAASRGSAVSDATGQWVVRGLPRVDVMVRASAEGRSTYRKRIDLAEGDVDLGTIELSPSTGVALTVSTRDGTRLENVSVETDSGFRGRTDKKGSLTLTALPHDDATAVTLAASGFAKQTIRLTPPLQREEHVILERAFSIKGSVVTEDGRPASEVIAVVTNGPSYRREAVSSDGAFAFDVAPGQDFELTFESPTAAAASRKEQAGRPGEVRDLGTIRLPSGLAVRGRITDSASAPVAGARIWAVRPSAGGVVTAWAAGRTVQAVSNADGAFELRGLAEGPALLRVDAPDFARAYREVVVEAMPLDLGAIALVRGVTVTIRTDRANGSIARLDLRGGSLDADMVTAPVVEGEARLRHVPPGSYGLTVVKGRVVVCDRRVDVKQGADNFVECPPPMRVAGRVLVGGVPASGGTLTWLQPAQTDALIETRLSPMGAVQQSLYGLGGGIVPVPIRLDGSFETRELRPGEWKVGWRSADGVGTPDRSFTIPDTTEARILVEFDGAMVRGRVIDGDGQSVAGARIREIQGTLYSMAAADGVFTMTGVSPGLHRLQASLGAKASSVVDVVVEPRKEVPEVVLRLGDAEQNVLSIRVVGVNGEPKPNAFVFVEMATGVIRTITADTNGIATTTTAEGIGEAARLVAFAENTWAFGEARRASDASGEQWAEVRFGRTGALRIISKSVSGSPVVSSPRVPGDLAWMLARLGSFVSVAPERPLVIHGLPAGVYEVALGSERLAASVSAGSVVTVELP